MSFKEEGSSIIMIGQRKDELGGSIFYSLYDEVGKNLPKPDLSEARNQIYAITDCIDQELVLACHDISEGGVATALAEMTFGNAIGLTVLIESNLSNDKILFSETGGFVLEAKNSQLELIRSIFENHNLNLYVIGQTGGKRIKINKVIDILVNEAKQCWEDSLREKL